MRKFINIILISFLTFNLTFTSFASEDQPAKEGTDQKAGEKIIITESVNPIQNQGQPAKAAENPGANKEEKQDAKKEEKPTDEKKDDQISQPTKDKSTDKAPAKEEPKNPNLDTEKLEKAVDDLVQKLDKNSNLSKALSEMQTSMSTESKDNNKTNEASKKTEAIIKDYNEKIQTATSDDQRKRLENEAAAKINSINSKEIAPAKVDNKKESNLKEDIPEKKKKILLEVKPEKSEDDKDDRSQILALNPTNDLEDKKVSIFKNPIIIVAVVFVIVMLVVIGIVIRNNDRKVR